MYSDRGTDSGDTGAPARPSTQGGDSGGTPVDVEAVQRRESSEVAELVNQMRGRADGFLYGDDRAIGARPNWAAHDSKQLYAYGTVNNEPGSAEDIGQSWSHHGGELSRIADDLYNAISELGAVWIGQGAGAAQGALVGMANSGAQASEAARTMRDRMAQQAAAAAKLKSMPQPKEFDPAAEAAAMLAGGPAAMVADLKEKFDAAQETKAQQVAFLEAYTTEMSEIDGTTPSFGPDSLGLKPMADGVSPEAGRLGAVGTYGFSGGDATAGPTGLSSVAGVSGASQAADAATLGAQEGGARHAGTPLAGGTLTGHGSAAGTPPAAAATGGGPGVGQSLGAAAVGGVLGAAGAKALSSGRRSGSRSNAAEAAEGDETSEETSDETLASANQQSGGAAPSATSVPTQAQSSMISGGTIGAAQTPPPAGTGAPGAPMGMGGARGGDDDKEHTHASFLIEPDPDATFGATESAAPPVLGAWGPDDEER